MLEAAQQAIARAGLTVADVDLGAAPGQRAHRRSRGQAPGRRRHGQGVPEPGPLRQHLGGLDPLALSEAYAAGKIKSGSKILMVAFGGGLSWGGSVVEWL
jgi:3-oxoacyl-[acyl-carrier-protein] synthase-3